MIKDQKGIVTNIQRCSLHDGPGIRTTVFLKGCYLSCLWCHNPETQSFEPALSYDAIKCIGCGGCVPACPQGCHSVSGGIHSYQRESCTACLKCVSACPSALSVCGEEKTVEEIIKTVLQDRDFYGDKGGMTLSGGEPFCQGEFAIALLAAAKKAGIHTAVETSGMAKTEYLIEACKYTDIFLYDIKESDPERHRHFTGADNRLILENMDKIASLGANIVLRAPIIPDVNDREEHFESIGRIAEKYDSIKLIQLLPYHRAGTVKYQTVGMKATEYRVPTKDDGAAYLRSVQSYTNKKAELS